MVFYVAFLPVCFGFQLLELIFEVDNYIISVLGGIQNKQKSKPGD